MIELADAASQSLIAILMNGDSRWPAAHLVLISPWKPHRRRSTIARPIEGAALSRCSMISETQHWIAHRQFFLHQENRKGPTTRPRQFGLMEIIHASDPPNQDAADCLDFLVYLPFRNVCLPRTRCLCEGPGHRRWYSKGDRSRC